MMYVVIFCVAFLAVALVAAYARLCLHISDKIKGVDNAAAVFAAMTVGPILSLIAVFVYSRWSL